MRKLLFFFVFLLISVCCRAQGVSYGIFAGFNETKIPINYLGKQYANVTQSGYSLGGSVDIKMGKFFSFQPGLYYMTKGGTTANDSVEVSTGIGRSQGISRLILHYGEMPLNFLFNLKTADGTFFIGGGPYLAVNFHTSSIFHIGGGGGDSYPEPYPFPALNTGDVGFNTLVGYSFDNCFTLRFGYTRSLSSLSDQGDVRNQGFNFSAGYFFR
jgi:hypothetical protein